MVELLLLLSTVCKRSNFRLKYRIDKTLEKKFNLDFGVKIEFGIFF